MSGVGGVKIGCWLLFWTKERGTERQNHAEIKRSFRISLKQEVIIKVHIIDVVLTHFTQLYHQRAEAKAIQDKVHKNWKNLRFADRVAVRRVLRKHFPHGSVKDAFDTLPADCSSCEERS